jgi:hypothetical protein
MQGDVDRVSRNFSQGQMNLLIHLHELLLEIAALFGELAGLFQQGIEMDDICRGGPFCGQRRHTRPSTPTRNSERCCKRNLLVADQQGQAFVDLVVADVLNDGTTAHPQFDLDEALLLQHPQGLS